jgi:hypothetical protein
MMPIFHHYLQSTHGLIVSSCLHQQDVGELQLHPDELIVLPTLDAHMVESFAVVRAGENQTLPIDSKHTDNKAEQTDPATFEQHGFF